MQKLNLSIEGMRCGGCAAKVSAALKLVPGITVESVVVGSAKILFDPDQTTDGNLIATVNHLGFKATRA